MNWWDCCTYITTLRTEEVTNMPLCTAGHHHFAFDWGLAALTPGAKEFVEIQMAIESHRLSLVIVSSRFFKSLRTLRFRLLVKSNTLQSSPTVMAGKAFRMEP